MEVKMAGNKMLFFASWIILLVVTGAITILSFGSLVTAYTGNRDNLVEGFTMEELRGAADRVGVATGKPDLGDAAVNAFKGRRATAATWALGYGLLALAVVLVSYRRGERWAWWALLVSIGLSQILSLARLLALHSTFGTATPGIILAFALLGLMAGAPRMFSRRYASMNDEAG